MLKVWGMTIAFSVAINALIEYLDTQPGYSCPIYCEVDHEHFKDNNKGE